MSLPPPIPVATLEYMQPGQRGRPGVLTAAGVLSIIVGALSCIYSVLSIFAIINIIAMMKMVASLQAATIARQAAAAKAATQNGMPSPPPVNFPNSVFSESQINYTAATVWGVECVLSIILATLLVIGGIQLLRNSRRYLRLHQIYIFAKIPLAFISAIAMWMFLNSLVPRVNMSITPNPSTSPSIILTAISIAYPIALLILLCSRTARIYDEELRGIR